MPEEVIVTPPVEAKALTPAEKFEAFKASKALAATPEGIAAKAAADKLAADTAAGVVVHVPEKRASGDERKFRRALSRRDIEIGELRAKIDALTPKQAAAAAVAAVDPAAAPKREAFASDALYDEARIAHIAKVQLDKSKADEAQSKHVRDTIAAYNAQIVAGPEKYDDWAETLEAGKGGALSVDLGKECPSLFWAIAQSECAADLFYAWLKDASKLQKLIDLYKAGPEGETRAIIAFHRFEGQVAKDAPAVSQKERDDAAAKTAKAEAAAKASKDAAAAKPKLKPSAEASVKGGAAAPDGKPALYVPGTHTINPAYKAYMRAQRAA
jgi:hypothetical protein